MIFQTEQSILIALPNGFMTVLKLLGELYPDDVLICSIYLYLITFSIFLELIGALLSLFCLIGFPNVTHTYLRARMIDFALVDLKRLATG